LREDRHGAVHDLNDVIRADGERVVGRISDGRRALRSGEADAEAVEARHDFEPALRAHGGLLDILLRAERDACGYDKCRRDSHFFTAIVYCPWRSPIWKKFTTVS